ncbi:DEAD/DEAH box helicase family protein [Halorubrum ezzemoulense]|uniref:DEAD/DEAH box helicase family protein n=1 Tax=Halorubrum ezzemoulense TaxID=337243 RepID=A0ABT4YXU6_HALEZ|nr:DEAD/DEAH box helicase family protein [Halorubrum ezzemoulense]MDB2245335.1 DEAD/DEAH box helicase family protein [Halorubrum ezzemoulense]MDB2250221.1 DEAD/DEAH box helicase family protein [Halorubrum ezzemoulense]MDB2279287.1 DEAD/DEAH box helicase family protein [Halorubrum ezzemoulense]MDB2285455.1 DEAD/DEAH box helicase family protein [Halorubrum ezzemoulense]MDB2287291.1 DEAD/DEAH box helicase family protein [Halorubrum ezzemoulense]
MEFEFDPDLEYQQEAVDAVTDVFDGQPNVGEQPAFGTHGTTVPNELALSEEQLTANTRKVQQRHDLAQSDDLYRAADGETTDLLSFSVDMETGTGKTYVYLRTIHELYRRYGWRKFLIVVPSVAIREGVVKTIQQTRAHFDSLYSRPPFNWTEYDSSTLSDVIRFGSSSQIEVMVMTLQSINRSDENVMFRPHDKLNGDRPVDRIAATNPIAVLDEPQNMEGEKSKAAISALDPLCTLRYSATHRRIRNKVYELSPVDAHEKGLVKTIEVLSVVQDEDFDKRYVRPLSFDAGPKARIELYKDRSTGAQLGKKTVRAGDSLYAASNGLPPYEGVEVASIDARHEVIELSDGTRLHSGESTDTDIETIQHRQIRETVREHFEKALDYRRDGIKVLSLFFIDRIDNFRGRSGDETGHLWEAFCEAFTELKAEDRYSDLFPDQSPEDVAGAYFATTTSGDIKVRESSIRDDVESYELIMRDKETLLSADEPTQFIFSHSALQEGWDNPNVFQICTLNNTVSSVKKRQEIGRGVRLPVYQDGTRLPPGDRRNRLTVIANESYADYADDLQAEYSSATDYGDDMRAQTNDHRDRTVVTPRTEVVDESPAFARLWERIAPKTTYTTTIDSPALVESAAAELAGVTVDEPRLRVSRGELSMDDGADIETVGIASQVESVDRDGPLPDVVSHIAAETGLTKQTVAEIILESETVDQLLKNPHAYRVAARETIDAVKTEYVVEHIDYERIGDAHPTDILSEVETYAENTVSVDKSVYDKVICDSEGERRFARRLDRDDSVALFIKLPREHQLPTPIGPYNPDWAVLFDKETAVRADAEDRRLYLIRETKFGTEDDLRPSEATKIECARAHYDALNVDFDLATDFRDDDIIEDVLNIDVDAE